MDGSTNTPAPNPNPNPSPHPNSACTTNCNVPQRPCCPPVKKTQNAEMPQYHCCCLAGTDNQTLFIYACKRVMLAVLHSQWLLLLLLHTQLFPFAVERGTPSRLGGEAFMHYLFELMFLTSVKKNAPTHCFNEFMCEDVYSLVCKKHTLLIR